MPTIDGQNRLIELDSMRGIAAMSVVLFHYTTYYAKLYSHTAPWPLDFWIGRYGVELFFMISGYVIFLTLDKTNTPKEFIVSRFSRLYPVYWVAVLLTYSITSALSLPKYDVSLIDAIKNMSMVQESVGAHNVDGVYWTLQKELGFYLMAGTLFYSAAKKYTVHVILTIVMANILILSLSLYDKIPGLWRVYNALPIEQLYLFCLGIALYLFHKNKIPLYQFCLMTGLCLLGAVVAINIKHLLIVAALFVFLYLAINVRPRFLRHPYLLFLGAISYPLYLIHNNIGSAIMYLMEHNGSPPTMAILFAVIVAIAMATLLNKFVEKPTMKWIRSRVRNRHAICDAPKFTVS